MKQRFLNSTFAVLTAACLALPAQAQDLQDGWLEMSDEEFATTFADMAFGADLSGRELVAWMYFARMNQQIAGPDIRVDMDTGTVPLWMAWATDPETFTEDPSFEYTETPRDDPDFVTSKDVLAGEISTSAAQGVPNGGLEEVTRNELGYDYIVDNGLNTYMGVLDYVVDGNQVDMPIGAIETKMKWVLVDDKNPAPEGAQVYQFTTLGKEVQYWWAGIHVMAKMRPLPDDPFSSEEPSWFWSTFQFTNGDGVQHVRDDFITERAPFSDAQIETVLTAAGIDGIALENYSPNGTQIGFTLNGDGETPVILGHTMMEDFAGSPDTADPAGWTSFESSCHTCHATASINPETGNYFPFTVPTGALPADYSGSGQTTQTCEDFTTELSDGYVSLDFMWPFVFNAKPKCPS